MSQTAAPESVNDPELPNITKLSCTEIGVQPHTVTKADNYRSNSENILHTNKKIRMGVNLKRQLLCLITQTCRYSEENQGQGIPKKTTGKEISMRMEQETGPCPLS